MNMMNTKTKKSQVLNVLCLEDSPFDVELTRESLLNEGYNLTMDSTYKEKEFVSFLRSHKYDIIISDFKLPGFDGFTALKWSSEICPDVPFICVSGTVGEETAVDLLKRGAVDYVLKENLAKLPFVIKRALQDVKEKKDRNFAEEELNNSEVRYRRLFESAKDGILILDAESGMIVDVNPFLVELLGYSTEQFHGKKIWEIGIFKDILANKEHFLELQQKEYIRYENLPLKTIDGRQIWVEFVSNVYLVDQQKVIQCNIRDITERKLTEKALQESELRYKFITQHTADIIWMLSLETGKFTYVSPSVQKLLGFTPEEAMTQSMTDILTPEYRDQAAQLIQQRLASFNTGGISNQTITEQVEQICKNGSSIPTEVVITIIADAQGQPSAIVGVTRDIRERKLAEEKLLFQNAILSTQQEASIDGILVVGGAGNIISYNQRFIKMWDISPALLEKNADESILAVIMDKMGDSRSFLQQVKYLNEHHKEASRDDIVFKDGRTFDRYSAPMFGTDSKYYGRVWYFRDITERKRMEDALKVSKDFLDRIINSVASPIFVKDHKHKFCLVNNALCSLLNLTVEKLIGTTGFEYFPKEQMEVFIAKDEEVFNTGNENINEEFITDGQGKTRTIITRKTLYTDTEGNKFLVGIINDITERKIAEEKIKFNNVILTTQQEVSIDGILVINDQGEIISFNQRFIKMWNISLDVLEMKADRQTLRHVMDMVVNPEEFLTKVNYLYEHIHETSREEVMLKDGRTFDRYSAPMLGTDEKYYGRVWYFRDISERIMAEELILKERTLLKTLIDNLPNAIFVKDKDYRKILANTKHLSDIAGHFSSLGLNSKMDIIGKTDFEVYPKEWAEKYFTDDQKVIRDGESIINKEEDGIASDGDKINMLVSKVPLHDKDGKINGLIGITTDITKLKLVEKSLDSEQYLMYALMNNVPDRIYFKDRASRFIRISKAQAQLFGLNDPVQAVGKSDSDFYTKEHARHAYEDEQEIIRTGLPISKEEKEIWPNCPDTWVQSTKLPLKNKEGNIIGTFGISMDITIHKETELMLIQKNQEIKAQNEEYLVLNDEIEQTNKELILAKEKAEESDKLKTSFLQNMSHEIRTPMNGILGFAELLKNPKLPEVKQQEFVKIIEKSGQRMLNIISDIVNISKIETGQIEVDLMETNVNSLMQHLQTFFSPAAEKKGLDLIFKPGLSNELCKIETDDIKLTQVLSNLIGNALKFTKAGSIDFGYQLKNQMLEFYVQDTGIGIALEMQDVIFERFRQVDMADARIYEGAGLGLTISKAFVEKLGGKIWVQSELGQGSAFFFNIPYNSQVINKSEKPKEATLEAKFSGINILIAEDDDVCMAFLKEVLEAEKATLFFANNGQEALDIVKSAPEVQIVLMDLKMPVMNGFEATKLIRKLRPDLPIIAQSAYAFSNDQDKAKMAGCDDFIGKPVKRELLLSKINKQLAKKHSKLFL